ncbi:MAG: copper resistance protein B [Prevotellaceae bacterium]|nr:copper resistance protein B [Prevotellaceae bacterium]
MKRRIFLLVCLLSAAASFAQSETGAGLAPVSLKPNNLAADSLAISPPLMTFNAPWSAGIWDIHDGFNASVSAGVSCGFGKNNPYRGAAFFTSLEGLYAMPVNDRLTLAAGLGYTRYTGWGRSQSSLDIFGLANYRFNDRLDATLFLSHSFSPTNMGGLRTPYVPAMNGNCTAVGADVGVKVSDAVRIDVGFTVYREETPHVWASPANAQSAQQPR